MYSTTAITVFEGVMLSNARNFLRVRDIFFPDKVYNKKPANAKDGRYSIISQLDGDDKING